MNQGYKQITSVNAPTLVVKIVNTKNNLLNYVIRN